MKEVGLVLEGGGLRGVYTAGVLETFLQQNLMIPYVIGVSAGACNAASYISRQSGRNKIVNVDLSSDPRYISWRNFWRNRTLFGMDFLFDEIPNRLVPFDYDAFFQSEQKFIVGTTDCETGEPIYFDKDPSLDMLQVLRASSSLPFISPTVEIASRILLDGGIADPIPLEKSIADGNKRNIVVLTQRASYRKDPFRANWLAKRVYREFPRLIELLATRHEKYNQTLDRIEQLEKEGKLFVFRPSEPFEVGRVKSKPEQSEALYELGRKDAIKRLNELYTWLENNSCEY